MCEKCIQHYDRILMAVETADVVKNHDYDDIIVFNSLLDMLGLHEMIHHVRYTVLVIPSEQHEDLIVEPLDEIARQAMREYGFPKQENAALVFPQYRQMAEELGCI